MQLQIHFSNCRMWPSGLWRRVVLQMVTKVSEKSIASILRVSTIDIFTAVNTSNLTFKAVDKLLNI
jgi:hypothetical protein